MTGRNPLQRKPVMAASRLVPAGEKAQDDLAWLAGHGALSGVAEILRERRRQLEVLGHTAEHDDAIARDRLVQMAEGRLSMLLFGARHDHLLHEAGALIAAEIDRLRRAAP